MSNLLYKVTYVSLARSYKNKLKLTREIIVNEAMKEIRVVRL